MCPTIYKKIFGFPNLFILSDNLKGFIVFHIFIHIQNIGHMNIIEKKLSLIVENIERKNITERGWGVDQDWWGGGAVPVLSPSRSGYDSSDSKIRLSPSQLKKKEAEDEKRAKEILKKQELDKKLEMEPTAKKIIPLLKKRIADNRKLFSGDSEYITKKFFDKKEAPKFYKAVMDTFLLFKSLNVRLVACADKDFFKRVISGAKSYGCLNSYHDPKLTGIPKDFGPYSNNFIKLHKKIGKSMPNNDEAPIVPRSQVTTFF